MMPKSEGRGPLQTKMLKHSQQYQPTQGQVLPAITVWDLKFQNKQGS